MPLDGVPLPTEGTQSPDSWYPHYSAMDETIREIAPTGGVRASGEGHTHDDATTKLDAVVGFWDAATSGYKDAAGTTLTSHPAGMVLILAGGTVTQKDAQTWVPSSFVIHLLEEI